MPSFHIPHFCRWHFLWRFDAYFWVPFSWGQNNDLVQELIDTGDQVVPVPGFIGDVTEQLRGNEEMESNT